MTVIPQLKRVCFLYTVILLLGAIYSTATSACTAADWQGGASGSVNPDDPNNSVSRVSGYCGLEFTGAGYIQDGSPSAETSFISRFYFFPELTGVGNTDIFIAYSDEAATTVAITIKFDGTNIILDATAVGGSTTSLEANTTGWNIIEFAWESGTTGNFWVNSDATIDAAGATFAPGSGSIESVRLGSPNGFGGLAGKVTFDEYVSNRTQAIGMLLAGDANLDGDVNSGDIDMVVAEFLSGTLANGVVDCNLDGAVNSGDIDCIVSIFLGQ